MILLIDLFGYLSIIVHGLAIIAQAMTIGGTLFLVLHARPTAGALGTAGAAVVAGTTRMAAWSALALAMTAGVTVAIQSAVLNATLGLSWLNAMGADVAIALMVKAGLAVLLAVLLLGTGPALPGWLALSICAGILGTAIFSTHAAARVEGGAVLLGISALHQFGAALWIGGIPSFVAALRRVEGIAAWRIVGERFSTMSIIGVGCIAVSAAGLAYAYIGDIEAAYGTAYGVMSSAKALMFAALLALGHGNFRLIRSWRHAGAADATRLRRFSEVEIGIGFTLFFAAASLTSVPPSVDLGQNRVTMAEIIERHTPHMPRFVSPDHDGLALPALQAKLDAEAAAKASRPPAAFVPGSGVIPARNANDIAWSEYNHHWAGFFVVAIALLALANQAGVRTARHWPLMFLGLAAFLFVRSDPEVWPLGHIGFIESLREVEVLQHRFFVVLITLFGIFEWRVRTLNIRSGWTPYVFPLVSALGGAALLTHSHAIGNVKEQLLIELTHTLLALAGVAAGWARWLELRLNLPGSRVAGWVWPVCFLIVGATLIIYREA